MPDEITLTEEETAALVAVAKVHREYSDPANVAAADNLIASAEAGHVQILPVDEHGGEGLRNILIDLSEAARDDPDLIEPIRPEFRLVLELANRLDALAAKSAN
jgi:hypothetical protein